MRRAYRTSIITSCLPTIALLLAACAAQRVAPVHPGAKPPQRDSAARPAKPASADKPHVAQTPAPKDPDALAPGDVGYYMDVLLGRLRQLPGVECRRRDDQIIVAFSGRFELVAGHAQADAELRATLAALAQVLIEYRKTLVSVQVGASRPGAAPDETLAQRSVQAAAQVLASSGLASKRIATATAAGAGAGAAAAATDAPSGARVPLDMIVVPLR